MTDSDWSFLIVIGVILFIAFLSYKHDNWDGWI